jgi:cytochrome c553
MKVSGLFARCMIAAALFTSGGTAFAQSGGAAARTADFPAWAFLWVPDFVVPKPTDEPQRLSGSNAAYSWVQARDLFVAPDWHPENHAAMPDVVARGRKPDVRACGSCHRAEGTGGPENASLAGLPAEYFVQQMDDFKSGARKFSAPPQHPGAAFMTAAAKNLTAEEIRAAANYFAALKPQRVITVVERDTAPKTIVARLFYAKHPEGGTEALGRRIVEMPDDVEQFELRDTRTQFTAYVPPGSIATGEALAKTGGGKTLPCAACHGADLKGAGAIPGIAGRSPTYMVRQLYQFKHGVRASANSAQMKPVAANLNEDDMIALAAYVASLAP